MVGVMSIDQRELPIDTVELFTDVLDLARGLGRKSESGDCFLNKFGEFVRVLDDCSNSALGRSSRSPVIESIPKPVHFFRQGIESLCRHRIVQRKPISKSHRLRSDVVLVPCDGVDLPQRGPKPPSVVLECGESGVPKGSRLSIKRPLGKCLVGPKPK